MNFIIHQILTAFAILSFNQTQIPAMDSTNTISKVPDVYIVGHSWAVGSFVNFEIDNLNISVQAKVGSSMQWAYDKISKLDSSRYDYIVIFTGINDYLQSVDWFETKFNELINISLAKANKVIVYNIPRYCKCEQKIIRVNDYLNLLKSKNIIILDVWTEYKNSGSLHPNNYDKCRKLLKDYFSNLNK